MKLTLASLIASTLVVGVAGFACGRTADASPAPVQAAAPGKSSASADGKWTASISKAASGDAFQVVVNAVGDFHINDEFPVKFTTADATDGLTYPTPVLTRKDNASAFTTVTCKADKSHSCSLTVTVPYKLAKAGKYTVGGTLKVGLCSAANCLNEKIALDFEDKK